MRRGVLAALLSAAAAAAAAAAVGDPPPMLCARLRSAGDGAPPEVSVRLAKADGSPGGEARFRGERRLSPPAAVLDANATIGLDGGAAGWRVDCEPPSSPGVWVVLINATEERKEAAEGGSLPPEGYRYYRFTPTENGDGERLPGAPVALFEFVLRRAGAPLLDADRPVVTNPGGDNIDSSSAPRALDGNTSTRWIDWNGGALVFSFRAPTRLSDFTIVTGAAWLEWQPAKWRFEGSSDGSSWVTLHEQATRYEPKSPTQNPFFPLFPDVVVRTARHAAAPVLRLRTVGATVDGVLAGQARVVVGAEYATAPDSAPHPAPFHSGMLLDAGPRLIAMPGVGHPAALTSDMVLKLMIVALLGIIVHHMKSTQHECSSRCRHDGKVPAGEGDGPTNRTEMDAKPGAGEIITISIRTDDDSDLSSSCGCGEGCDDKLIDRPRNPAEAWALPCFKKAYAKVVSQSPHIIDIIFHEPCPGQKLRHSIDVAYDGVYDEAKHRRDIQRHYSELFGGSYVHISAVRHGQHGASAEPTG